MVLLWAILIGAIATLALTSLVVMRLGLVVVTVQGSSMQPTLAHGDRVFAWRFFSTCWLRSGQIVIVRQQEVRPISETPLIKRIVGMPGETLITSLDDLPEHERPSRRDLHDAQGRRAWHIPARYVFVRGDQRAGSLDSLLWGPVPVQHVEGIVFRKLSRRDRLSRPQAALIPRGGLPVGQVAPPFTATTLDGRVVTHADYAQRSVLFFFLCPCPICHTALVALGSLPSPAAPSEHELVLVSLDDEIRTRLFLDKSEVAPSLSVLVAPRASHPFARDYAITMTPFFCLIDAQGMVRATGIAPRHLQAWQALIALLEPD